TREVEAQQSVRAGLQPLCWSRLSCPLGRAGHGMTNLTLDGANFSKFVMLYLDETGRFIDVGDPDRDEARLVQADELERFLKRTIALPKGVTDVFVWVHGWQNDELRAGSTAKRMFANLADWFAREPARYPRLGTVVPGFVAVHWPSSSLPTLSGYKK